MDKNQPTIIFDQDTGQIISDILKKYDLEENDDKIIEKLENGDPFNASILINLAESVISGIISEANIVLEIQKRLNTANDIAINLFADLKSKIIPFGKVASKEEIVAMEEEEKIEAMREKTLLDQKKTTLYEPMPLYESAIETPDNLKKDTQPNLQDTLIETKIERPENKEKQDAYREPLK